MFKYANSTTALKMIAMVMAVFFMRSMANAQKKIDGKADIVIVLAHQIPDPQENPGKDVEAIKAEFIEFAKEFEMADDKTRFAVTDATINRQTHGNRVDRILLNLTSDRNLFENVTKKYTPHYASITWEIDDVLEAVDQFIFTGGDDGRAKAVVYPSVTAVNGLVQAGAAADKLVAKGVWIYTVARNPEKAGNYKTNFDAAVETTEWIAHRHRRIIMDEHYFRDGIKVSLAKVKEVLFNELCGWTWSCQFMDAKQTRCDFVTELNSKGHLNDVSDCDALEPNGTCTIDQCNQDCDAKWPWNGPTECGSRCGVHPVSREGPPPDPKLTFCPTEVVCPCTTTQPPAPNDTKPPVEEVEEKVDKVQKDNKLLTVLAVVIPIVVLLLLGAIIGIVVFAVLRKNKAQQKAANERHNALMKTIAEVSVRAPMARPGAETGTVADLTVRDASMKPGGSKKPGSIKEKSVGPISKSVKMGSMKK